MDKQAKIFVAGSNGLVGSAIVRRLQSGGYTNLLTPEIDELDLEDWPTRPFTPSAGQATGSLLLVVAGFGISWGVSRIGRGDEAN